MSNPIKYTTGSESLALNKGNFYIGTGDVGKGPSNVTGYYDGVTHPSGGYTIYMYKSGAPGDLSYHTASNDTELISFTNNLAGQSYTTVNQCLSYYAGQTDKVCFNRDYEQINTDGLLLNVDLGFTSSYPRNGTTLYDLSTSNNDMTVNGSPTFTSEYLSFNSNQTTKYMIKNPFPFPTNDVTMECWVKFGTTNLTGAIFSYASSGGNNDALLFFNSGQLLFYGPGNVNANTGWNIPNTTSWYHIVRTRVKTTGQEILYINGSQSNTFTLATNVSFTTNGSLVIAQEQDTTGGSFDAGQCFIGDFSIGRIYDRALSSSEILQNYNAQKGRFGL